MLSHRVACILHFLLFLKKAHSKIKEKVKLHPQIQNALIISVLLLLVVLYLSFLSQIQLRRLH